MRLRKFGSIAFCAALVISLRAGADDAKKAAVPKKAASMADHILTPDMLKFTAAPPVLPAGCEVAGLNGEMPVGGFHAIPKRVHHYGMAKGQTIIQLHGVGPWGITYVNPSDDPSKKAAEK